MVNAFKQSNKNHFKLAHRSVVQKAAPMRGMAPESCLRIDHTHHVITQTFKHCSNVMADEHFQMFLGKAE